VVFELITIALFQLQPISWETYGLDFSYKLALDFALALATVSLWQDSSVAILMLF
jgi:hypothetical protein